MRVIPNMVVLAPGDAIETRKVVIEAANNGKPTYIRFTREATPVFTTDETPFKIGRAEIFWDSVSDRVQNITHNSVALIACGPLVYEALLAAKKLDAQGVGSIVVNCHTIKPIDEKKIVEVAKECGKVVTVEEHQVNGGLGSAVAEVLARNYPVPMGFIGMNDSFGESGKPDELLEKYGMKSDSIRETVEKIIEKRGGEKDGDFKSQKERWE